MRKDSERPEGAWVERPYLTGNEDSSFMPRYERPVWPESNRLGAMEGVKHAGVVEEKKSRKRPGISPGRVVLFVLAFAVVGLVGFVAGRAYEYADATGTPMGTVLADRLHVPESALVAVENPLSVGAPIRKTLTALVHETDGDSVAPEKPPANDGLESLSGAEPSVEDSEEGTPWEVGHPDFQAGNMGVGYVSKGVARHFGIGMMGVFLQVVHDLADTDPEITELNYHVMYPSKEEIEARRAQHTYEPLKPSY